MGARRAAASVIAIVVSLAGGVVPPAAARISFHPRIGPAMGLVPVLSVPRRVRPADVATGAPTPVVYHGGPVMAGGVTVHTIFWAPPGYAFLGSPGGGTPTYEGLIKQFFGDVAHDSGAAGACTPSACNEFSVLPQYAEGTSLGAVTPGAYAISYDPSAGSVDDTNPYPVRAAQCASPAGTATCLTDGQVQAEIDRVIQSTPGTPRGLSNLWFVFLPPAVDECIDPGSCGTTVFAGYHEISNLNGHGLTVYAVAIDPIIELQSPPGGDPNGNPDAEATLRTAAEETLEAMTDPEGSGWMDPNGFEIGDKCDAGPQVGTPLGFAANGSPYNQVINGHQYLLQEFWANLDSGGNPGCAQATPTTANQLPLAQVNLRQFNPVITGNVNRPAGGGIGVTVRLLRGNANGTPVVVARASTTTAADGSWRVSLAPHAVGDDRDEVDVDYSGAGSPQPSRQVILTGNGGDPFTEAGWTGWSALDAGTAVRASGGQSTLTLAPCFQAGVLSFTFDDSPVIASPSDFCNTQTNTAAAETPSVGPGDRLTVTSNDNRAFSVPMGPTPNPLGGLVSLTVPVGEANSISLFTSPLAPPFTPTGLPTCVADLEAGAVGCFGLVPGEAYQVTDRRRRITGVADATGRFTLRLRVRRGDLVSLSNGARTLTTLHVAHLQVAILGEETVLAAGRCQPGAYYGLPPTTFPPNSSAGAPTSAATGGAALTGEICPTSGDAAGLPTAAIAQTDDLSGGLTRTEVPDVLDTSPGEGETIYGRFTAAAETGLPGPDNSLIPTDSSSLVSLSIRPSAGGRPVFRAVNVDIPSGIPAPALRPGPYTATWVLTDANGDIRLVQTRFIEQPGSRGGPQANAWCERLGQRRLLIHCIVTFNDATAKGTLHVRLTRGGHTVAVGHASVRQGVAVLTMRQLRRVSRGAWRMTLVLSAPPRSPRTITVAPAGRF